MMSVAKLTDHSIQVSNNEKLQISLGKSRYETSWKNQTMLWSVLLSRLSKSLETPETHAEYMKMSKDQQDRLKDIGGFVGGYLKDGKRRTGTVVSRRILTLDMDFAPKDLTIGLDAAYAVYSTHKHTKDKPRLRLVMPLDREVSPDEYEAVARKVAEKIGGRDCSC